MKSVCLSSKIKIKSSLWVLCVPLLVKITILMDATQWSIVRDIAPRKAAGPNPDRGLF